MTNTPQKLFQEYQERFKNMTDTKLIEAFNQEVGNNGWTIARSEYLAAMHEEFERRGYDYSAIGDKKSLSFKEKIELKGKKIIVKG